MAITCASRGRTAVTRSRLVALIGLFALVAAASSSPATPSDDLARLQRDNLLLRQMLELAKGEKFYLILDTRASTLTLMLRGATLHTWRVAGIEIGGQRVAFVSRDLPENWEGRVWDKGRLDPERKIDRFELVAPPPTPEGTETDVPIPPTPEEAYPVPARYHIRFDGGLSIEVVPPSAAEEGGVVRRFGRRIAHWWSDAWAAVSSRSDDAVRLRLILSDEDANSLYRALPPDTKLFIPPPAT